MLRLKLLPLLFFQVQDLERLVIIMFIKNYFLLGMISLIFLVKLKKISLFREISIQASKLEIITLNNGRVETRPPHSSAPIPVLAVPGAPGAESKFLAVGR